MPTRYLTAREVLSRFRISSATLWRWERDPDLGFPQPLRIGRGKRYVADEIDAWETQQLSASGRGGEAA